MTLTNSDQFALIDANCYRKAKKYLWHVSGRGYVATVKEPRRKLHIFLFGKAPEGLEWDHRNRNKLDNRKENLRLATRTQNLWNTTRRTNRSGFKGVYWEPDRKQYLVQIQSNHKCYHLGRFTSKIKAAKVYDKAARKLHGEFAVLNFSLV